MPGAARDGTKNFTGCDKNEMQSDFSCNMISKPWSMILSEARIVLIFIERETQKDRKTTGWLQLIQACH